MKIRKITIENNPILGNISLDFTNTEGNIYDTIILVGENGSGKSTLMNIIYSFSLFEDPKLAHLEKRKFEVELSNSGVTAGIAEGTYMLTFDNSINNGGRVGNSPLNNIKVSFGDNDISRDFISNTERTNILKAIFSDVSINFNAEVTATTNKVVDADIKKSLKSNENIAKEITQMLVDIYREDTGDLDERVNANPGQVPPDAVKQRRSKRFQNAFNTMFADNRLEYKKVQNLKPIFIKEGNTIEINNLSSGEKQIVFRGGFLLKDKNSIQGAVALIDEPEISMHPIWQKKILIFYKNLFVNDDGNQTSQVIFSTHSPYLLQSFNKKSDCIFIFPGGQKVNNLRNYIGSFPSLGVINYMAFHLSSIELHDELYGYIQDKKKLKQNKLEEYFITKGFSKQKKRIEHGKEIKVTLPTFIRNKFHHPEIKAVKKLTFTDLQFKKSIDQMISLIQNENL